MDFMTEMANYKETRDETLLQGILALFCDEQGKLYTKRCDIYLVSGMIEAIDRVPKGFVPKKTVDGSRLFAIPGLINAHTHTPMSLLRGAADDLEFNEWLFDRIMPLEDKLTPEDIYWGAKFAILEMIKTGTTCFCEMYMDTDEIARAVVDTGIRAVLSRGLVDADGPEGGKRRVELALRDMVRFEDEPRITFMMGPHSIYNCSEPYFTTIKAMAGYKGVPLTMHLAESDKEVEDCRAAHGKTPMEYAQYLDLPHFHLLAAHCVKMSRTDIDLAARNNMTVVTCPASNLKLGNGIAPVPEMMRRGIKVCIGTDSAASNNSLNMFREMNLLALLHKQEGASVLPAGEVFKMATQNAAFSLALGPNLGMIEEGRYADLVLLDLDTPAFTPETDLISALCYSASGAEVHSVIIDGKFVMEDRKILAFDEAETIAKAKEIAQRLVKSEKA